MRVIVVLLHVSLCAAATKKGYDEWGSAEIQSFFKDECRVDLSADALKKISAKDLFDGILLDDNVLDDLGVKSGAFFFSTHNIH
jgi:hypothetical protein